MNDALEKFPPKPAAQHALPDPVNHPLYYGGPDNPHEAIKTIEAWDLGFNLGNAVKCIARADKKGDAITDLKKAAWYILREISNRENKAKNNGK